ncbi:hypothetical protein WN51_09282 [Melipona quadrifasciata]|uniref:Uncharacterized protein n=1 Tax=Melipona quadrifasciata TaxID=166423 RepID=A0A0M9A5G0_9HYME|nr:hypothetical protein WN51_09282 [Melipona quadrifasciata]
MIEDRILNFVLIYTAQTLIHTIEKNCTTCTPVDTWIALSWLARRWKEQMTGNEREMGYRTGLLIETGAGGRMKKERREEEAWEGLTGFDKSVGNNGPGPVSEKPWPTTFDIDIVIYAKVLHIVEFE